MEPAIRYLVDTPEAAPRLVELMAEAWPDHYGPDGPGDAGEVLRASMNRDATPVCLVAHGADGAVAGTVTLRGASFGSGDPVAWVGGLLVADGHRGRGIGSALVGAVEDTARDLGFTALYMSTDSAHGVVTRRGWTPLDPALSEREGVRAYRLDL